MKSVDISTFFSFSHINEFMEEVVNMNHSVLKSAGKLSESRYSSAMRSCEVKEFKLFKYKNGYFTYAVNSDAKQVDTIPLYNYYLCIPIVDPDSFKFKPLLGFCLKGFNSLQGVRVYLGKSNSHKLSNKCVLDFYRAQMFEFIPLDFPHFWRYINCYNIIVTLNDSGNPFMYDISRIRGKDDCVLINHLYDKASLIEDAASEYAEDGEYV